MDQALVFEKDDRVYIVGPVAPIQPQPSELEEFAFADVIRSEAPNELLLWLRGQYVEADRPNANGQLWTADDLAIASLTPRLMPVTVMHDPRTAVGLIADTRMLTPDEHQVPRSRIDTALAIWKHRYPEVVEEALDNYARGSLTQSMECLPGFYDCVECGKSFVKLPGGAERANWCAHLRGETAAATGVPARRLRAVQFTGTGLIFGTRGARGAFDKAHLETFREEVAEFHERARTDTKRRQRRMETIEIPRSEYDELRANATRAGELTQRVTGLEETAARIPALEKQVEELEISKKKAEDELADERAKREQLEESARAVTLADERLGKVGEPFKAKLPDSVKARLEEQAKTMSEQDWSERLEELAAMTGVKPDEQADPGSPAGGSGGSFSREETARAQLGGGNGGTLAPSRVAVSTVLGGLLEQQRPKRPEPAQK